MKIIGEDFSMTPQECVLEALGDGARTFQIARRVGLSTRAVRTLLLALERDKLVCRDDRLSAVNDLFWRPISESLAA